MEVTARPQRVCKVYKRSSRVAEEDRNLKRVLNQPHTSERERQREPGINHFA